MNKNILLAILLFLLGAVISCIDPAILLRDNKTDNKTDTLPDNNSNDKTGGNNPFVNETPPVINDNGTITVTDKMLAPFAPGTYTSSHVITVSGDGTSIIIDNGTKVFTDTSLSTVDNCSRATFDNLTEAVFENGNKIYITNRRQLYRFNTIYGKARWGDVNKTFVLVKDIDMCAMKDFDFEPLGAPVRDALTTSSFFWATFDGNNHYIKNIYINRATVAGFNCAAFICGLNGSSYSFGKLKNIGISGSITVTAPWTNTSHAKGAGVVGFTAGGLIQNVVTNLDIAADTNVGGIVGMITTGESGDGYAKGATINNVKNYATVKGKTNVGGIVGIAYDGNFANASKGVSNYSNIVNWGQVISTSNDTTTLGALFGVYKNHNDAKPTDCKNGAKQPSALYGTSSGTSFTCE